MTEHQQHPLVPSNGSSTSTSLERKTEQSAQMLDCSRFASGSSIFAPAHVALSSQLLTYRSKPGVFKKPVEASVKCTGITSVIVNGRRRPDVLIRGTEPLTIHGLNRASADLLRAHVESCGGTSGGVGKVIKASRFASVRSLLFPQRILLHEEALVVASPRLFRKPEISIIDYRTIRKTISDGVRLKDVIVCGDSEVELHGLTQRDVTDLRAEVVSKGGEIAPPGPIMKASRLSSVRNLLLPHRIILDEDELIFSKPRFARETQITRIRYTDVSTFINDGTVFRTLTIRGGSNLVAGGFSGPVAEKIRQHVFAHAPGLAGEGRVVRVSRFSSVTNLFFPEKIVLTPESLLYVKARPFVRTQMTQIPYEQVTHLVSSGTYRKRVHIGGPDHISVSGWFTPGKVRLLKETIRENGGLKDVEGKIYKASHFSSVSNFFSPQRIVVTPDMILFSKKIAFKRAEVEVLPLHALGKVEGKGKVFKRFKVDGANFNASGFWIWTYWGLKRRLKRAA